MTLNGVPAIAPASSGPGIDLYLVGELRRRVAERLRSQQEDSRLPLSDADERALAVDLISQELRAYFQEQARHGRPGLDFAAERATEKAVFSALYELGPLQPLLNSDMENCFIHGARKVRLQLPDGRLVPADPVASTDAELIELLSTIASRFSQTSREFSRAHPLLSMRLPDGGPLGARLAASMEVTPYPVVTIRRHRLVDADLSALCRLGTLDQILVDFLTAAVRAGKNMIISGAPSAGKTTLLRAVADAIPAREHVVTVEDVYELGLHVLSDRHPLVTAFETRDANAEGAGALDMYVLLTQTLRHSPDRVIVGEVRGGEVAAMLLSLSNGTAGGLCTLHARSARAVPNRIIQLAQLGDSRLRGETIGRVMADAIDLIVHVSRTASHGAAQRRYLSEVIEVGGLGEGNLPDFTSVFTPDEHARAVPDFAPSPRLVSDLRRAGFDSTILSAYQGRGAWPGTPGRPP